MVILPFSPCPERHLDRGRTESLIAAVRVRMRFGMPAEEIRDELINKMGVKDEGNVFLIITAASLLEK